MKEREHPPSGRVAYGPRRAQYGWSAGVECTEGAGSERHHDFRPEECQLAIEKGATGPGGPRVEPVPRGTALDQVQHAPGLLLDPE